MVYNRSDFLRDIDNLTPDGFERTPDLPVFKRVEPRRELTIQISTRDYFPHGVYISGVIVDISLFAIENIYQEVLQSNPLPESVLQSKKTLSKVLNNLQEIDYTVLEEEINDKASFKRVGQVVARIIELGALPFFDKFKTVGDVREFTRETDIDELANLIGQPLPFRQMIIQRLSGDPAYSEYSKMVIDFYKDENDPTQLGFAEKLKAKLESIDPVA